MRVTIVGVGSVSPALHAVRLTRRHVSRQATGLVAFSERREGRTHRRTRDAGWLQAVSEIVDGVLNSMEESPYPYVFQCLLGLRLTARAEIVITLSLRDLSFQDIRQFVFCY